MSGIRVFKTLEHAQSEGFVIFDRIPDGYLVRKTTGTQFALAIVKLEKPVADVGDATPSGSARDREPANYS